MTLKPYRIGLVDKVVLSQDLQKLPQNLQTTKDVYERERIASFLQKESLNGKRSRDYC